MTPRLTSPALQIRRARPEDASAIQALYLQLTGQSAVCVLPERIASLDERSALFVAEMNGEMSSIICGTAFVALCADVMYQFQPFALIENVVVDPGYRGCGVGAALFRAIESYCKETQCSKMMLMSASHRHEAHQFFKKQGFSSDAKQAFVKYRKQFSLL